MRDKLGLINSAIAAFGGKPLQAVSDETPGGRAAGLIYDETVDACLGFYPWSFNRRTVPLQRLDEEVVNGWTYVYQMPPARLSLPQRVLDDPRRPDAPLKDWAVEEDRLFADREPLWGVFPFRAAPATWPPVFAQAVIYALAAGLVVPISGNASGVAEAMRQAAFGTAADNMRGGWMGQAMQADARNQPSRSILLADNPLAVDRAG